MSSAGQAAGYLVGGIVGYFVPVVGWAVGAQIGGMIGGYIDPPKGPKGNPPSADQLRMQTSAYGVALGRGYGRYARTGNLFWIEGNSLRAVEVEGQGGKGGASVPPTYEIYGTFAVGFGELEISSFRRLWFGSKLVYDAGSDSLSSIIASNDAAGSFSFYTGSASQLPDPRIQADLGVDNTPAWRGMPYIVVKDWPMADFGNTLAGLQVKAEIVTVESTTGLTLLETITLPNNGGVVRQLAAQGMPGRADYAVFAFADPLYTGTPSGGNVEAILAGFLSPPSGQVFSVANTQTITPYRNYSPTYIGCITRDYEATPHYFVNGVEAGEVPALYEAYPMAVWVDEGGSSFLGIATGPDTVGVGTGHLYLTRTNIASGTVTHTFLCAYVAGHSASVPKIVVAGGVGYVVDYGHTYVFDVESLAITEDRASSISPAIDMHLFVDDTGRVWKGQDTGVYGVSRLNETLTDYDLVINTGHSVCAAAISSGILYTADYYAASDIVLRAYRISGTVPELVPLADIVEAECLLSRLLAAPDIDVSALTQDVRGYQIGSIGALRNSLTPLQSAWPFDIIPRGYQIKFVPRGQAAVATIPADDLGAVAGNEKPGVRITAAREMDSQLPRRVQVSYIDANREYDIGAGPGAERLNTDAVNVQQNDLGIVLTANEAAGIEESLLYMYWLERVELSFVLPPTYAHLEPADVVDVVDTATTYNLRLTNINYLPDGRLECQARFNNPAVYSPTAVGQEGIYTGQIVALTGASQALLLDIPVLLDGMDAPGFTVAMVGYLPGWSGGSLIRSDDNGQTWGNLQGFVTPGAVMGSISSAIPAGRTDLKDEANEITVSLQSGSLSSVTELQLFGGANHFAVGADGRWEIVGAQSCVQQADGKWKLSSLLRGRFGSEWAMGSSVAGDALVHLDSSRLKFIASNVNAIGQPRKYRAISNGKSIDSASDIDFTYTGENLECLAPVYLNGHIDQVTKDWSCTWQRRTRVGGEWRDYVDASLGEAAELYEVEIWNSTYTTLKRTITSLSSASFAYTAAQQIADFGSKQTTLYLKIFQVSATAGRGQAYVTSLSRSIFIVYDPYFSYLVLGLHMDGTNGSTTFTDIKGNTITANGNAAISTSQSKFNGASAYFDGTGDYLDLGSSSSLDLGTSNWTFRCWARPTAVNATRTLFGGNDGEVACSISDGALNISMANVWSIVTSTGLTLVANTWYFLEFFRSGNTFGVLCDGVLYGTATYSNTMNFAGNPRIGKIVTGQDYAGYIDDAQLYKGVAVNVSGYTVPTAPFPDQ